MDDARIAAVVREAIDLAAEAKGWSLAQLARRVGLSIATLHRWRSNATSRYDLAKLATIFRHAGLSMDEKLDIGSGKAAEALAAGGGVEQLQREMRDIRAQLSRLAPLASLLEAVMAMGATASSQLVPESDDVLAQRAAASLRQEALAAAQEKAIALGEKPAAEPAAAADEKSA